MLREPLRHAKGIAQHPQHPHITNNSKTSNPEIRTVNFEPTSSLPFAHLSPALPPTPKGATRPTTSN
jgi:hypothetical protein